MFYRVACIVCLLFLAASCENKKTQKLFQQVSPTITNIDFANTITDDTNLNILRYNYFYNGGGIAAADFNNDGYTDLYFTGNQVSSELYLNNGKRSNNETAFSFKVITEIAGVATKNWATGASVADVNNDGLLDMYISYAGYKDTLKRKHQLFINTGIDKEGIPHFKDEAESFNLNDTSYTTQSVFFDYDKDNDLDLLLINHYQDNSNPNYPQKKDFSGKSSSCVKLYRNDSNSFKEVATAAGIRENGYSLGVTVSDINLDGWPDIYITKDFIFDDVLYINNQNGTFTESIKKYIQHTSQFSMGCDIADYNNDGYPDIVTVDMLPYDNRRQKLMNIAMNNDRFNYALSLDYLPQYSRNMLQLNNGPDNLGQFSFSEIGQLAGIYKTDWSWSPLFADFDNDGRKDLFISNGIPRDITNNDFITYRGELINSGANNVEDMRRNLMEQIGKLQPVALKNFIYQNKNGLQFEDKRETWGLDHIGFSTSAVYVDLDNDGDLDIVTNNINDKASIFKNNSNTLSKNNYISIRLKGKYSLGAKLSISCNSNKQFLENYSCRGFQSYQDPLQHFGLGKDSIINVLKVVWLDGKEQQLVNIKANQIIQLDYQNAKTPNADLKNISNTNTSVFTDITALTTFNFLHVENLFEDFNYEPLLPHRFSRSGPYISVGDINADGLEDCWIGGADNKYSKIYIQKKNGKFSIKNLPDTTHEDIGGLLFDADGDKDLDLYVVSGGNEYNANTKNYQDRLYKNDGKGNFKRDTISLPKEYSSGSVVSGCDFDKDGDIDLFVGGKVVPGSYSFSAESFLLKNNGIGKFTNVSDDIAVGIKNIGMVTAALWTDIDNDGWQDLIITGEWMPIVIYINNRGILIRSTKNILLEQQRGWWNCINAADFDKDGDLDYIVGNLGVNNKFNVSLKTPLTVYANDFDSNGYIESIITYYLNNKEYTISGRDQIASVLPSIKKKFDNYSKFAEAEFHQIFSQSDLQNAVVKKVTTFESVYLENKGNGVFVMSALPIDAQFSTIQTTQILDFDKDGNLDILIAGNNYNPEFTIGQYDGFSGLILLGNGKGKFKKMLNKDCGFVYKGEARSTAIMTINRKKCLLTTINNNKLLVFEINTR
ncbi:MAG: RNA-binding protein [Sphingobacteriia bacterium]|nr:MAG: RNA-binding protein [Sphingobacteriia bacterium]